MSSIPVLQHLSITLGFVDYIFYLVSSRLGGGSHKARLVLLHFIDASTLPIRILHFSSSLKTVHALAGVAMWIRFGRKGRRLGSAHRQSTPPLGGSLLAADLFL